MARVRAGIINWPGKGIPSSNINGVLNGAIIFSSRINFLSTEIGPNN